MAREDSKPSFSGGRVQLSCTVATDPKQIGKDSRTTTASMLVISNSRDFAGNEGSLAAFVTCFGNYADYALDKLHRGSRIFVDGRLFFRQTEMDEYDDNGEKTGERVWGTSVQITADAVCQDPKFYSDEDDEEEDSSRRSRRSSGSSSRRSASSRRRSTRNDEFEGEGDDEDDENLDENEDEYEERQPAKRRTARKPARRYRG